MKNQNPEDISLPALIAEDFRTHDRDLLEPGFWAVAIHRFGNWRMGIRPKVVRAPFSAAYRFMHRSMDFLWGIDLDYGVKLGRRVRIWHHGCMLIGAKSIGNDVHIRHSTTMGVVRRTQPHEKPVIGDRVDIGAGVCILGDVTVGDDTVIGANSVVVRSCPPGSVLFGVPARPVRLDALPGADSTADKSGAGTTSPSEWGIGKAVRLRPVND